MELTDKAIEYIKRTNNLFNIKSIETYRDGGTISIKCTKDVEFFGDKDTGILHTAYPTTVENRIYDQGLLDYLSERIHGFLVITKLETKILENIINNKLNIEK